VYIGPQTISKVSIQFWSSDRKTKPPCVHDEPESEGAENGGERSHQEYPPIVLIQLRREGPFETFGYALTFSNHPHKASTNEADGGGKENSGS
jgi:hypothetical protein